MDLSSELDDILTSGRQWRNRRKEICASLDKFELQKAEYSDPIDLYEKADSLLKSAKGYLSRVEAATSDREGVMDLVQRMQETAYEIENTSTYSSRKTKPKTISSGWKAAACIGLCAIVGGIAGCVANQRAGKEDAREKAAYVIGENSFGSAIDSSYAFNGSGKGIFTVYDVNPRRFNWPKGDSRASIFDLLEDEASQVATTVTYDNVGKINSPGIETKIEIDSVTTKKADVKTRMVRQRQLFVQNEINSGNFAKARELSDLYGLKKSLIDAVVEGRVVDLSEPLSEPKYIESIAIIPPTLEIPLPVLPEIVEPMEPSITPEVERVISASEEYNKKWYAKHGDVKFRLGAGDTRWNPDIVGNRLIICGS